MFGNCIHSLLSQRRPGVCRRSISACPRAQYVSLPRLSCGSSGSCGSGIPLSSLFSTTDSGSNPTLSATLASRVWPERVVFRRRPTRVPLVALGTNPTVFTRLRKSGRSVWSSGVDRLAFRSSLLARIPPSPPPSSPSARSLSDRASRVGTSSAMPIRFFGFFVEILQSRKVARSANHVTVSRRSGHRNSSRRRDWSTRPPCRPA